MRNIVPNYAAFFYVWKIMLKIAILLSKNKTEMYYCK